jgi:plasmid maintenance system antidote protein VapI
LERSYLRDLIVGKKQTIRADMIEKVAEAIGATPQELIALQGGGDLPAAATQPAAIRPKPGPRQAHPADHRRRHRRLQVPRPDPAVARARRVGAAGDDEGRRRSSSRRLSVGALAADKVFTELFDREDEQDVGHIRLAREAT